MLEKKIYVVFEFFGSTDDIVLSNQFIDWESAVHECFELINKRICLFNESSVVRDIDLLKYDEVLEYLDNGQNICFNNNVYGILDITPEVSYDDYVVALDISDEWHKKMCMDAFKRPFRSLKDFDEYMKRLSVFCRLEYKYMPCKDFGCLDLGDFVGEARIVNVKIAK